MGERLTCDTVFFQVFRLTCDHDMGWDGGGVGLGWGGSCSMTAIHITSIYIIYLKKHSRFAAQSLLHVLVN